MMGEPSGSGATLITCFVVAAGRDEAFLAAWLPINAYMTAQPGYVDHSLHRSADPWPRYRFVNVAHWSDANSLTRALRSDGLQELLARPEMVEFPSAPGIFDLCHRGGVSSED